MLQNIILKVLESNFTSKPGMAAAVMSACNRPSKRQEYIQQLQQAGLDVHVYGSCGKPCPTESSVPEDCYKELSKTYKFFLSFENSMCKDYVTEKLFGALKQTWVPVVRGGANYSIFVPERSVIDASSHSPAELAVILREIASNETIYRSYLDWKKKFTSELYNGSPRASAVWVCDACQKLRNITTKKNYEDIYSWWVVQGNCSTS